MTELIWTYPQAFGPLFVAAVVLLGLAIVWLVETSPLAPFFQNRAGIAPPFAGTPAVLFSLIVAVMIQDIWHHHTRAQIAVAREADAIRTIRTVAAGIGDAGGEVERLAVAYADAAAAADWRSPASREAADAQVRAMLSRALFGALAQASPAAQRAIIDAVADIRTSRRERVEVGDAASARMKWLGAFVLGVATLLALALIHLGKPRTSRLAVGMFGLCMAFVLWTSLVRTDVFVGPYGVPMEPIAAAGR